MREADLILEHAAQLATPLGPAPCTGPSLGNLRVVPDGAVAAAGETLVFVGPSRDLPSKVRLKSGGLRLDVSGKTLLPGFVDPHTHLPFAGSRAQEFKMRLAGRSYEEIAVAGGGILRPPGATPAAGVPGVASPSGGRLGRMRGGGATTRGGESGD